MKAKRLELGDTMGVVSPSRSLSIINDRWVSLAEQFFNDRGVAIHYSKYCRENWHSYGGTIEQRVEDLMSMFTDERIKGIITTIGGYGSNHLLQHLDYEAIKSHPKIFVGYSDITTLCNAIHAKTGLVTFYGPHFSTLGQPFPFDYTIRCFDETLFIGAKTSDITESPEYADDVWYLDAKNPKPRNLKKNPGWSVVRDGSAEGPLVGGNISTFQKLLRTEFMPDTKDKVLFFEEWQEIPAHQIDSVLTQFRQAGIFDKAKALLVGRFHSGSGFEKYESPEEVLARVTKGIDIPVIYGLDFGHTDPLMTIPIGVPCAVDCTRRKVKYLEEGVI